MDWKEKVRTDYKGILSEAQIEETISYWENLLEQERKQIEKELVRLPVYYSEETPSTLVSISSVVSIINK